MMSKIWQWRHSCNLQDDRKIWKLLQHKKGTQCFWSSHGLTQTCMKYFCNVNAWNGSPWTHKRTLSINYTKLLLSDTNWTSILSNKKKTNVSQSGSEYGFFLKRHHITEAVWTQALYFCQPVLLENATKMPDFMYSSICILEKIWYDNFNWNGPNLQVPGNPN